MVRRVQGRFEGWQAVVVRGVYLTISELLVGSGGQHGTARRRVVHDQGKRRVEAAREVVVEARGVAAAAPLVHNEGRSVEPRRSERRYHVPSVGSGARGVAGQGRRVSAEAPWVSDGGPGLAREVQRMTARVRRVVARSHWVPKHERVLPR